LLAIFFLVASCSCFLLIHISPTVVVILLAHVKFTDFIHGKAKLYAPYLLDDRYKSLAVKVADGQTYEEILLKERKKIAKKWTYLKKKGNPNDQQDSPGSNTCIPKESRYCADPKWF
jgi:hypothetical protein